jgi:hypothetical protein
MDRPVNLLSLGSSYHYLPFLHTLCRVGAPLIGSADALAIRFVSTDGGGIRGLSELLILHEIMKRIQFDQNLAELPRPCDYFDLIGGTGTGG